MKLNELQKTLISDPAARLLIWFTRAKSWKSNEALDLQPQSSIKLSILSAWLQMLYISGLWQEPFTSNGLSLYNYYAFMYRKDIVLNMSSTLSTLPEKVAGMLWRKSVQLHHVASFSQKFQLCLFLQTSVCRRTERESRWLLVGFKCLQTQVCSSILSRQSKLLKGTLSSWILWLWDGDIWLNQNLTLCKNQKQVKTFNPNVN